MVAEEVPADVAAQMTKLSMVIFSEAAAEVASTAWRRRRKKWRPSAALGLCVDAKAVSHFLGKPAVWPSVSALVSASSWADQNWRMLECFLGPSTVRKLQFLFRA